MKDISMRRIPQQERSQQRVNLTTNGIARRAGISIGSLYRYFPDKDAILRALANRHQEQVRAVFDDLFSGDLVYLPLSVLLDRIIDPFVELHCACPAYKYILLGSDVSAPIAAANEDLDQEIVECLAKVLQLTAVQVDGQRARLVATVCKAQVKALLSLLTSSDDQAYRSQLTVEVKRMLAAYLEPLFIET